MSMSSMCRWPMGELVQQEPSLICKPPKEKSVSYKFKTKLCARAIVVAKAIFDKNPQYKSISDHQKPLQGRLAHELHEIAKVPMGPCGINENEKFQAVLSGYQITVHSKEHLSTLVYSGSLLVNTSTCTTTIITTTWSQACLLSLLASSTTISAGKDLTKLPIISVEISASCVIFRTVLW